MKKIGFKMHNLEIDQLNLEDPVPFTRREFSRLVKRVLMMVPAISGKIRLSLSFVDNDLIQELNLKYRQKDQVTDVLSFTSPPDYLALLSHGEKDLGEIIICYPRAREQARAYGSSIQEELNRLIVHGILHLLGFDHEKNAEEERKMMELQEKILSSLSSR